MILPSVHILAEGLFFHSHLRCRCSTTRLSRGSVTQVGVSSVTSLKAPQETIKGSVFDALNAHKCSHMCCTLANTNKGPLKRITLWGTRLLALVKCILRYMRFSTSVVAKMFRKSEIVTHTHTLVSEPWVSIVGLWLGSWPQTVNTTMQCILVGTQRKQHSHAKSRHL